MKLDRRDLMVGAVFLAVAVLWGAQQARRPACTGGACCPLPPSLSLAPSNSSTAVEPTNGQPGLTASESNTPPQR